MISPTEDLAGSEQSEVERLKMALCMIQASIVLYKEMSKAIGAETCSGIIEQIENTIRDAMKGQR